MSRERAIVLAIAASILAACSGAAGDSTATSITEAPTASAPVDSTPAPAPSDATAEATPVGDAGASTADVTATTAPTIEIEAQALPSDVTNAIRNGGGELAATVAWTSRYAPAGIPTLDGPGVHLVEADLEITRANEGWLRVDAMQWLYVDSSAPGVAATLDDLAADAPLAGWDRADESVVVDSAPCIMRTYTTSTSAATWILQGCEFPSYPGMISIGITRSAAPTADAPMPAIDPSIAGVLDDIGGSIDHVLVRFAPPATPDSTTTHTVAVTISTPVVDADGRLSAGALSGWARSPGEAGSVAFTGAPGVAWIITPNTVRFSSQGRLVP